MVEAPSEVQILRWTKQQDFCLRLGLLKALAAVLPSQRLSVANASVLRSLDRLYFEAVSRHGGLQKAAARVLGIPVADNVSVCDALLFTSTANSWGQPIDAKKKIKILEWAHTVGLLTRGNQITERGLLLKSVLPEVTVKFAAGDVEAWNPFTFSPVERGFFFYHLGESDALLWYLAREVGRLGVGFDLDAKIARRMTYEGMKMLLESVGSRVPMGEISRVRTLRELMVTIESELTEDKDENARWPFRAPRTKRLKRTGRTAMRHTTKNADHQAIPRFEILVDLGFLTKVVSSESTGKVLERERKAWKFVVTGAAERFARSVSGDIFAADWHWNGYASAVGAAGVAGIPITRYATPVEAFKKLTDTYRDIHRAAGHSPFDSLAIVTMLRLLEQGLALEVRQLHNFILRIKREGALADVAFFAAGNEPDRMFLLLKPNFRAAVVDWLERQQIAESWQAVGGVRLSY